MYDEVDNGSAICGHPYVMYQIPYPPFMQVGWWRALSEIEILQFASLNPSIMPAYAFNGISSEGEFMQPTVVQVQLCSMECARHWQVSDVIIEQAGKDISKILSL